MPKNKIEKRSFVEFLKKDRTQKNLKIAALFLFGFLIGIMFKSQATKTIVAGFDDNKVLNSDEIRPSIIP